MLAIMYELGIGVEASPSMSRALYSRAAILGYGDAECELFEI